MMELIGRLQAYLAGMQVVGEGPFNAAERWRDEYFVRLEPGFDDFAKEVAAPGSLPDYPEGACAIRSDYGGFGDEYWIDAVLPYCFRLLSIAGLVGALWPEAKDAKFFPDGPARVLPKPRRAARG